MPPPICTLRNEESDNIRGTIQVYIDGFCYYVELFMSMIEEPIKRGRPKRVQQVKRINFHLDADLYAIADQRRGDMTMTLFLNSVIRKALAK